MSKIEITYLQTGNIFRPMIPVWISIDYVKSGIFHALLDSGADANLFPASLGDLMGIDIKKGRKIRVVGIGSSELTAYQHKFHLYIGRKKFETKVDFSFEQNIPLLGRRGFFDLFKKISFSEKDKNVILSL